MGRIVGMELVVQLDHEKARPFLGDGDRDYENSKHISFEKNYTCLVQRASIYWTQLRRTSGGCASRPLLFIFGVSERRWSFQMQPCMRFTHCWHWALSPNLYILQSWEWKEQLSRFQRLGLQARGEKEATGAFIASLSLWFFMGFRLSSMFAWSSP